MAVKPHPFAPVLLLAINWAQPQDPEKKYPNLGRMRYAWMSEDYKQIKLLLKDGPGSWTEQEYKDEMMSQIKGHETFVNVEVEKRDDVYIVATFTPIIDAGYERPLDLDFSEFEHIMRAADLDAMDEGIPSITVGPWELFDKAMEEMSKGNMTEEMKNFGKSLGDILGQVDAQDKLGDIAKESGIEFEKDRVFGINPDGKLNTNVDAHNNGE